MDDNKYLDKNYIYIENDIHISKWEGGCHYYAMVGIFDAIEDDGTRKWLNYYTAHIAAIKYISKLNSMSYTDKMKL